MKNMFENSDTFTAYATIDAGYYILNELQKELNKPIPPIDALIYKATGYDKKKEQDNIEQTIVILNDIIDAKKVLKADYRGDEKMLTEILKLKQKCTTQI